MQVSDQGGGERGEVRWGWGMEWAPPQQGELGVWSPGVQPGLEQSLAGSAEHLLGPQRKQAAAYQR